jgi:RHS repeat-associated protein
VSGSISCDFQYAGIYYHAASGLNLTMFRAYNPKTGTWISRDPSGEGSGLNLYAYCDNSPINLTDPSGLDPTIADSFGYGVLQGVAYGAGIGAVVVGATAIAAPLGVAVGVAAAAYGVYSLGSFIYSAASGQLSNNQIAQGVGNVVGALPFAAAGGVKVAGVKAPGVEFSHWVPNRMGGPRSILNGNYVDPSEHYNSDPYRYPPGYQDLGPKYSPLGQQLTRLPKAGTGTAAGGGAAGMGGGSSSCVDSPPLS